MTEQIGAYKVALTAADDTTAGGVLSIANPEGADLIIPSGGLVLDITTGSDGAAAVDAGIAANGTTSSDTLIDGASVASAAVLDNAASAGTNGGPVKWGASQYLTITASADATGLVGNAYISWVRE